MSRCSGTDEILRLASASQTDRRFNVVILTNMGTLSHVLELVRANMDVKQVNKLSVGFN
jgi:hypothetical protein